MDEFNEDIKPSPVELSAALEDQKPPTDQATDSKSFSYETVVKEEYIIEDVPEPPSGGASSQNSKSLFCFECNKFLPNSRQMSIHNYRHKCLQEGKYTCQLCDKRFRDKHALTKHEQAVHLASETSRRKLTAEGEQFRNTIRDSEGEFKCTVCDERFQFEYQQKTHNRRHIALINELFKCEECKKAFASKGELASHNKRAHEKQQLSGKFAEITVIKEEGGFRCTKCGQLFEQRHLGVRHVLRHISTMSNKTFECSKCPKKFAFRRFLERHEATHEMPPVSKNSDPIKCTDCNLKLKNKRSYNEHIRRHMNMKESTYKCSTCEAPFGSKNELESHEKRHEKPQETEPQADEWLPPVIIERNNHVAYKCPECSMVYSNRIHYKNHAQGHVNIRNGTFKCEHCDKLYGSWVLLKTHLWRHRTGEVKVAKREQPFQCGKCERKFSAKCSLTRHMKFHEALEAGTFQCKICAKYLGSLAALAVHEQGHGRGGSPAELKCTECDRTFKKREYLRGHMQKKHDIQL